MELIQGPVASLRPPGAVPSWLPTQAPSLVKLLVCACIEFRARTPPADPDVVWRLDSATPTACPRHHTL